MKSLVRFNSKLIINLILPINLLFVGCSFNFGESSTNNSNSNSNNYNYDEIVYYSDFGAVGDGVTDDFEAIVKTHEYANEHNYEVYADENAKYYIGSHNKSCYIQTNTDWGNAEFIIDDRNVEGNDRKSNVFNICSNKKSYNIDLDNNFTLKANQKSIGLSFNEDVLLYIENSNKKDYIRYGGNQNNGSSRQEIIIVDKEGNVNDNTPILWDYDQITKMTAYPIDDKEILVYGGKFTTISNSQTVDSGYFARGIKISRSNAVLSSVKHYVTNEPDPKGEKTCAPYTGFYTVNYANNVTIDHCIMTGHTVYTNYKPTGIVQQGTYDMTAAHSNNVKWVSCKQSNDITNTKYWGVMSSNFCKNLNMEDCYLSRFDAHQGVYNASIKNTTLGRDLTIIGKGNLYFEKVERLTSDHFLQLRTDYGSTWQGDITFKDCVFNASNNNACLIKASWTDWDFGYKCYLPENILIDNMTLKNASSCYIYPDNIASLDEITVNKSKNPYKVTDDIIIKNQIQKIELASITNKFLKNVIVTTY